MWIQWAGGEGRGENVTASPFTDRPPSEDASPTGPFMGPTSLDMPAGSLQYCSLPYCSLHYSLPAACSTAACLQPAVLESGLQPNPGDYEEEEAESSTADGASYVVKPWTFEAEELTPRSASLPPLDHSKQRYWACLHPDSPPGGASGRAQACRFKSRTAVGVKSMLERTWAPKLLGKVTENSHGSGPAFAVAPSSSRRSRGAATCENPHVRSKPLMNTGAPLRTIVFVALGGGRLCQAGTHDWRANLPRYLGKFTGAKVIIYGQTSHTCFYCHNPEGRSEGCSRDSRPTARTRSSSSAPGACTRAAGVSPLGARRGSILVRAAVHGPVAAAQQQMGGAGTTAGALSNQNMKRLMHNEIFDFDASSKAFIENVDPEMLKGYKVHFYGDGPAILKQEIAEAAKSRGIQAQVHGAVSKDTVFQALCMGKGLRHESVRRPEKGRELPQLPGAASMRTLRDFMAQVRAEPHAQIGKWVDTSLRDETVYSTLCKRLCLCKSTRPRVHSAGPAPVIDAALSSAGPELHRRSRIKRKPRKSAVAEPGLIHLLEDALLKDSGRAGRRCGLGTVNY
eukprot:jgi/Tetstr1/449774/TSEL_036838.t1